MVTEIVEGNFLEEVIESDLPVVVDFSATWCLPCNVMADIIDRLAQEYHGRVKFYKMDVDKNSELADKLNVKRVPTLLFFNRSQFQAQVGFSPEEKIKEGIEKLCQSVSNVSG